MFEPKNPGSRFLPVQTNQFVIFSTNIGRCIEKMADNESAVSADHYNLGNFGTLQQEGEQRRNDEGKWLYLGKIRTTHIGCESGRWVSQLL